MTPGCDAIGLPRASRLASDLAMPTRTIPTMPRGGGHEGISELVFQRPRDHDTPRTAFLGPRGGQGAPGSAGPRTHHKAGGREVSIQRKGIPDFQLVHHGKAHRVGK